MHVNFQSHILSMSSIRLISFCSGHICGENPSILYALLVKGLFLYHCHGKSLLPITIVYCANLFPLGRWLILAFIAWGLRLGFMGTCCRLCSFGSFCCRLSTWLICIAKSPQPYQPPTHLFSPYPPVGTWYTLANCIFSPKSQCWDRAAGIVRMS